MHAITLKVVPVDVDRLVGVMRRAGVRPAGTPYISTCELLADVEQLARDLASARVRLAEAQATRDGSATRR